jgi:ribosomal protein L11 methylase PrmA
MPRILDPEGAHLAALRRLGAFVGRRVLEFGCGDGRLTLGIAPAAESVFAFDADAEAVEGRAARCRQNWPSASPSASRQPRRSSSSRGLSISPVVSNGNSW